MLAAPAPPIKLAVLVANINALPLGSDKAPTAKTARKATVTAAQFALN